MFERNLFRHFQVENSVGETIGVTAKYLDAEDLKPKDGSANWLLDGERYINSAGETVFHGLTDGIVHT